MTGQSASGGAKVHLAVDTPGHVVALHVTPASTDDRAEVGRLSSEVQAETGDSVELAFVDQGYSGPKPAAAARAHGIDLEVVKAPEASAVSSCCHAAGSWSARLPGPPAAGGWSKTTSATPPRWPACTWVAFVCLMLKTAEKLMTSA